MLTVRLPVQTEEELKIFCERNRITRSQAVKEALVMYMENRRASASPYELGSDLFGQKGSGQIDASTTYKTQVKKMLNEKYTH